ncbi:tubulin-specific chaperone C (macronuclear) [Tetrahymena thermophila SB210]|uniref:Tubulin-specific chaperone C n=1 Tax=Tetrahymena thermophila (strain SB210) TaxID=312017 RepID=I7M905_TETTS|nr:tubulin-specific chaperone C [Tetrahymena thermophila SB210]EAS00400.2 tubulin-specific chaperone C [Tetrahymena thermophila SB210]|eukprot:XP_001020645.2 tubulin-specific chaperone C [Tetrahymena thermophila SB210]
MNQVQEEQSKVDLKKKQFEELLQKQEQDRQAQKEQKKVRDEIEKDPKERMLTIQKEFRQQYDKIQDMIKKFNKNTSNVEEFFSEFAKLKEYFVTTNYALTTFDKQQYKEQLEKMEKNIFQARDLARPRKKFRFSQQINKSQNSHDSQQENNQKEQAHKDFGEDIPGLINISNEKIVINSGEENKYFKQSSTIRIVNITDSEIYLNDIFDTVYIRNINNSKIYIGPVKFSLLIDGCKNSLLNICGHQLRIHNSVSTHFQIFSTSKCIIEHCTSMIFSPYKHTYDKFEQHFNECGMKGKENQWRDIQDFNWLKQEASPNFILKED